MGKCLCELRAGQYWRLENYYLTSIHLHLPPQVRRDLKQLEWTKSVELANLAHHQGQHLKSATWLHKVRQMPKAEFQRKVAKELTGKDREPSELIYFKVYRSQIPVIEQAIETAALLAEVRQVSWLLPGDDLCGPRGCARRTDNSPCRIRRSPSC
jgi:hypothetical protein